MFSKILRLVGVSKAKPEPGQNKMDALVHLQGLVPAPIAARPAANQPTADWYAMRRAAGWNPRR
jgi:hypothetical protein